MLPDWLKEVKNSYLDYEEAQELLSQEDTKLTHFKLNEGLIWYKNRVYVGKGNEVRKKVLGEFHSSARGGREFLLHIIDFLESCTGLNRKRVCKIF